MFPSSLSDRRVLAMSAAGITTAILIFLVGTYPTWRRAIGVDGPDLASSMPPNTAVPGGGVANSVPTVGGLATPEHMAANEPTPLHAIPDAATAPASGSGSVEPAQRTTASDSVSDNAKAPSDAQPDAAAQGPTFDIVRVEPSGDSVIAGRAQPGADIVLLDQGQPIARAKADATGQVAFVPPPLSPGEHSLMLSIGDPKARGPVSSQSVAVSVAAQGKSAPMVALIAPGQPTKLLSGPASSAAGGAASPASTGDAPAVAVRSVDVEDQDGIYATGKAAPNTRCNIYINGSFVAAVTAGADGVWSLKIKRGMRPGRYSVRVDQLSPGSGQVQARAEVPFDFPDRAADGASLLHRRTAGKMAGSTNLSPAPSSTGADGTAVNPRADSTASALMAPAGGSASTPARPDTQIASADNSSAPVTSSADPTIVTQLLTTKVIRGDSLWRISRKMLGHGLRYTQIYAANTTQIRDPKLIYPGQIFVMPQETR